MFLSHQFFQVPPFARKLEKEIWSEATRVVGISARHVEVIRSMRNKGKLRHPDGLRDSVAFCGDLVKEVVSEGGADEEIKKVHKF